MRHTAHRFTFLLTLPFIALIAATAPAAAQSQVAPPPAADAPPPPLEIIDDDFEPDVTIRKRDGDTIEEHRIKGRLYKIVVTPAHGVPYVLVDPKGDGTFVQIDQGAPQIAVPMWVLGTF